MVLSGFLLSSSHGEFSMAVRNKMSQGSHILLIDHKIGLKIVRSFFLFFFLMDTLKT